MGKVPENKIKSGKTLSELEIIIRVSYLITIALKHLSGFPTAVAQEIVWGGKKEEKDNFLNGKEECRFQKGKKA